VFPPPPATGAKCAGNLKWSRLLLDIRTWFEGHVKQRGLARAVRPGQHNIVRESKRLLRELL
jgi:hypothetical protein